MSGFQAVNTTLSVPDMSQGRSGGDTTPTTPRPNSKFFPDPKPSEDPRAEDPTAKTPTRNSFAGLPGQRPLPAEPFTPSSEIATTPRRNSILSRGNSHRSTQSVDSHDVEMGDDDDTRDGSDNESVTSDTNRPSKKKKGQRFFCTDFPPCQLSFTRSEHLARHIRKHTGERPFQCHCSRRFSRLDNLRQHAQTVHVNEDIPGDSLAATSTRFQRQIRTDKIRTPGRSRANTLGSQGGHSRGHSRNLSTSSITSTASSISITQPPDVRRRPPTLAMANDATARARLSLGNLDTYNPPLMGSPGPQIVEYSNQSTGATTPTSATFSTGTGSPSRYGSGVQSPQSTASRPATWGTPRTPGRRLSVPSGTNPFQPAPGASFPPPYMAPLPSSASSTFSGQSSLYGSPTTSNFPESRRESNAEADWRRRTWHPGTYPNLGPRPATSYLSYVQTPDGPPSSVTSQPAASQTMRLPGIESFDHAPPPPSLPRRQPSPMQVDNPPRPVTYHTPAEPPSQPSHEKRKSISWDTTLQKDINRLQIASPNPPSRDWSHYPSAQSPGSSGRPTTAPHPTYFTYQHNQPANHVPPPIQVPPRNPERLSQEQPVTPLRTKRQAWYNGPLPLSQQPQGRAVQRTSPEDSSSSEGVPTPSSSSMTEYHPAIRHSNGFVEDHPPGVAVEEHKPGPAPPILERNSAPYQPYQSHTMPNSGYRPEPEPIRAPYTFGNPPPSQPNAMQRLEALVAVATGEQQALGHQ